MKLKISAILALVLVLAGSRAFADSQDFNFNGSELTKTLNLTSVESHTLYESVPYQATCSETVSDGYHTVCHTEYEQHCTTSYHQVCSGGGHKCNNLPPPQTVCWDEPQSCHSEPYENCHSTPHQECHQEEQFHTNYYSCTKYHEVAVGEETDFSVKGQVTLKFPAAPAGVTLNEVFTASLSGDSQSLKLKSNTKRVLIYLANKTNEVVIVKPDQGGANPGEKLVKATYEFSFLNIADVTSPISRGINDYELDLSSKTLSFSVGKIVLQDLFGFYLDLKRDKFLSDKTIVDADIRSSDLSFEDQGDMTRVTAKLASYEQGEFKSGTYIIKPTVSIKANGSNSGGSLLNPEALPSSQSISDKVKIKM